MKLTLRLAGRGDNGTSARISPFNFHPMISGAASVAQATAMVEKWLLTEEGFCLTAENEATLSGGVLASQITQVGSTTEWAPAAPVVCGGGTR
jgi:hypothetical protein